MRIGLSNACFIIVLGSLFGLPAGAPAQEQLKTKEELTKAFDRDQSRRNKLFSGEEQPTNADKKVAESAAEWYIYRITHRSWAGLDHGKVQFEFNALANTTASAKNNRAFLKMFGPALVNAMTEVLKANERDPTTVIHACMMFPTMARFKQDQIGEYLGGFVRDDKSEEIVRLYALKAFKEFLPVDAYDENSNLGDTRVQDKKARDLKYVDTLVKYIERPVKVDAMPLEEVAAVRFLRREAIIALAHAETPAIDARRKAGKVEGAIAPTLLKVLANTLQPPPSLQERIEASLGLCKMKYWNPDDDRKIKNVHMPEYQPEVAVYLIGKSLDEFVGEYKKDYFNFVNKGPERKLPRIAFKTEAKRFEAGLKELSDNARGTSAKGAADKLMNAAAPMLKSIYAYGQPDNQDFRARVVPSLRPKTGGYVFKNLKLPEIPLPPDLAGE